MSNRRAVSAPMARFNEKENILNRDVRTALPVSLLNTGHGYGQQCTTSNEKHRQKAGTRSHAKSLRMDRFPHLSVNRSAMTVWRLQGTHCQCLQAHHHGFFHEGSCYIVLRVFEDKAMSLHYWFGSATPEHERDLIHDIAHDIDVAIDRADIFTREFQGRESHCFETLFPDGIVYIEGRPRTSISVSQVYFKRMYVVTGRKYPRASCIEPSIHALDPTKSVILDGFPRIYVWTGKQASYISRIKAIQVAKKIRNYQRNGIAHIVVLDDHDSELCKTFLKKLQNGSNIQPPVLKKTDNEVSEAETAILHRLNGDRVLYDMPFVAKKPLQQRFLTPAESYLLAIGPCRTLYVWVGSAASLVEVGNSLSRAKTFSEHLGNHEHQSLCRLLEGSEPTEFKSAFCDWREKVNKHRKVPLSCSINTIGEPVTHTRCDRQTLIRESNLFPPEYDKMGSTEVWKVKNCGLQPMACDEHGIFVNSDCYVITHTCRSTDDVRHTIFYWLGSKTDRENKETAYNLAISMDFALDYKSVVIRVLDGKEPLDFLNVIHNTMIVYDHLIMAESSNIQLYAVTECQAECMRVSQVSPSSGSLTTDAAFILLSSADCFLWYGERSGGLEREYAKHMLGYLCPKKQFSYSIVTEGKEPSAFWEVIGAKVEYVIKMGKKVIGKRSPRLVHYLETASGSPRFEETEEFEQADVYDEDIVVLDTFDEIFIWCGQETERDQRKSVVKIAKDYIAYDLAGRENEDVLINFISQGAEPLSFTAHFKNWSPRGYGSKAAYDLIRKRVRQENAKISLDVQLVDKTYQTQPQYPYKMLMSTVVAEGVKVDHKQHHLSDKDFEDTLGRTRTQFYQYPAWKQEQILRSARLDFKIGLVMTSQNHSQNCSPVPPLSLDLL